LLATNLIEEIGPALAKGHDFIKKSQVYMLNIDNIKIALLPLIAKIKLPMNHPNFKTN